jgi:hypothetical protein
MYETIEQMDARHHQERAARHAAFAQGTPVQRDPQIEEDARELLKPLSFDFDAPIKWRGQSGHTHRDEVIAAADAGVQAAQQRTPHDAVAQAFAGCDEAYQRMRHLPEIDTTPPPSFKHGSLRDLIKTITTHPGRDGASDVKRMLGKPFNAIELTADQEYFEADGCTKLPAGSWLFEMSTTDGAKMWVPFSQQIVDGEYRELSEETASEHVNARMFAVLAQLFPGATIAQMENAVADGKYIAYPQREVARLRDDAQRMKAAAEVMARELETARPAMKLLRKWSDLSTEINEVVAADGN